MISVIIPNYNNEQYLAKCLNSVRNQTYRDWECIIVDDGSTDNSLGEIDRLVGRDNRFKVVSQSNQGLSSARNAGMREAKGDFFFLDADDYLESCALSHLSAVSSAHPDIGRIIALELMHYDKYNWMIKWDINPKGLHKPDSPYFFTKNCDPGHATACLYRRDLIPHVEFPQVRRVEDMLFNMELMFAGVSSFVTDRVIYHYVRRDDSLLSVVPSGDDLKQARKVFEALVEKYHPGYDVTRRCRLFMENCYAGAMKGK